LGYVRLLEGERAGPINETQRHYLRVILENSQRMVEALDSLSALAARRRRRCVLVDFGDLWNESIRLTRLRAAIKGIRIVQHPPAEGLIVYGDRDDLAFAAHKILANAVKATAPGGTIELQLARDSSEVTAKLTNAEAGFAEEGHTAMLGCCRWSGCPAQFGEESATTGMPLVHDIIATHAGRISSTASPDSGWTLTLSLPATRRDS
jgi:signal transduction histidine kinase